MPHPDSQLQPFDPTILLLESSVNSLQITIRSKPTGSFHFGVKFSEKVMILKFSNFLRVAPSRRDRFKKNFCYEMITLKFPIDSTINDRKQKWFVRFKKNFHHMKFRPFCCDESSLMTSAKNMLNFSW